MLVSFERPTYTVNENDGSAQLCFFTNTGHPDHDITVAVQAQMLTLNGADLECMNNTTAIGMSCKLSLLAISCVIISILISK